MPAQHERNALIYQARQNGQTLQAIGDKHGITRERVRQIVRNEQYQERLRQPEGEVQTPGDTPVGAMGLSTRAHNIVRRTAAAPKPAK